MCVFCLLLTFPSCPSCPCPRTRSPPSSCRCAFLRPQLLVPELRGSPWKSWHVCCIRHILKAVVWAGFKFCLREPSSNNFPASSLRADSGLGTTSRHLITWKFCIHSSKTILTHQQDVSDSQIRSPVLLQCVHTDLPSGTHLVEAAQKFEVLIKLTFGWKILVRKNPFGGEAGKSFERTSLILNWPPGAVLYKSRCVLCIWTPFANLIVFFRHLGTECQGVRLSLPECLSSRPHSPVQTKIKLNIWRWRKAYYDPIGEKFPTSMLIPSIFSCTRLCTWISPYKQISKVFPNFQKGPLLKGCQKSTNFATSR